MFPISDYYDLVMPDDATIFMKRITDKWVHA